MQRLTITLEVLVGYAQLHRLAPDTPVLIGNGDGNAALDCAEVLVEFREDGSAALTLAAEGAPSIRAHDTPATPERSPVVDSAGRNVEAQRALARALRERSVLNRLTAEIIREQGRQIRRGAA